MTSMMTATVRSVPLNDLERGMRRDRALLETAVSRVLDSGYVVMGPQHAAFQTALAEYVGVAEALGVASGTDALELAMRVGMPEGKDTVLVAANAGGYGSTAARRAGFRLRYAEVDERSHCLTLESITEAMDDSVGVVVITHLYGNLTDIQAVVSECRARGVRVVEDCAQALGARRPEGGAGAFGDLSAVSFYPTKNLGALGDGGAVLTNSPELASEVAQLRQYGWDRKYHVAVTGGMNSRLDELQAAFLLARLPLLDGFNERRRSIVARYVEAAQDSPLNVLPADGPHHVAHLAVAVTEERTEIRGRLRELGVSTDVHFPVPDHLQPGFAAAAQRLGITERLSNSVLSLPCFPEMTDDEVEHVCGAIGSLA